MNISIFMKGQFKFFNATTILDAAQGYVSPLIYTYVHKQIK